jgi:hypothetical protein
VSGALGLELPAQFVELAFIPVELLSPRELWRFFAGSDRFSLTSAGLVFDFFPPKRQATTKGAIEIMSLSQSDINSGLGGMGRGRG